MLPAHGDFVDLQRRIWVKLAGPPEKFSQPAWAVELQPYPAVVELELLGEAPDYVRDFIFF
jgi:hypothetical protein